MWSASAPTAAHWAAASAWTSLSTRRSRRRRAYRQLRTAHSLAPSADGRPRRGADARPSVPLPSPGGAPLGRVSTRRGGHGSLGCGHAGRPCRLGLGDRRPPEFAELAGEYADVFADPPPGLPPECSRCVSRQGRIRCLLGLGDRRPPEFAELAGEYADVFADPPPGLPPECSRCVSRQGRIRCRARGR